MLLSKTYFLKEEKTLHDTSSKLEKKTQRCVLDSRQAISRFQEEWEKILTPNPELLHWKLSILNDG